MPHTTQPQFNHGSSKPRQLSTPVKTFAAATASTLGDIYRVTMVITKLALCPFFGANLFHFLREAGIVTRNYPAEAFEWVMNDRMFVYSDYIVPVVALISIAWFILYA